MARRFRLRAQEAIAAAKAEAEKRGWPVNIAVVDSGANLVAFARMDGAQIASRHRRAQGPRLSDVSPPDQGFRRRAAETGL